MTMTVTGRVWRFGDRISTDLMLPGALVMGRGLSPEEAAGYCMSANRPGWSSQVRPGDILVAGKNFGCGSSRNASVPLRTLGISCVLADSISTIHLRNAINSALPTLECAGISTFVDEGEQLTVNIETGVVENPGRQTRIQAEAWPKGSPPYEIFHAGGFDNFVKRRLEAQPGVHR